MTIQAALAEQELRWHPCRQAAFVLRQARMAVLRVAALAKKWCTHCQHARLIRAVRVVAATAVLRNRCMLPEVGAAFLGMTIETGVIERLSDQKQIDGLTVGVVTISTIHFSLAHRMCVGLHGLGALLLMTVEADVRLGFSNQHCISFGVAVMTARAGHRVTVMIADMPGGADVIVVTVNAVRILLGNRRRCVAGEGQWCRAFCTAPNASCVVTRGAVAGFTLQLAVTEG